MTILLVAATVLEMSRGGVDLKVDSDLTQIDPAKSVFLRIELKAPSDRNATLPDLRDRVVGFSLAEDVAEEEAWKAAKFYDSPTRPARGAADAYRRFAAEYPAGRHADEARSRISELERGNPGK